VEVKIDLDLCAGYGNCVDAAPDVFQMSDDSDIAEVLIPHPEPDLEEAVRKAARVCPSDAVILIED
jgi:ferredoxin